MGQRPTLVQSRPNFHLSSSSPTLTPDKLQNLKSSKRNCENTVDYNFDCWKDRASLWMNIWVQSLFLFICLFLTFQLDVSCRCRESAVTASLNFFFSAFQSACSKENESYCDIFLVEQRQFNHADMLIKITQKPWCIMYLGRATKKNKKLNFHNASLCCTATMCTCNQSERPLKLSFGPNDARCRWLWRPVCLITVHVHSKLVPHCLDVNG